MIYSKTHKSTESFGKIRVEEDWLIPRINSILARNFRYKTIVGVIGTKDCIHRHVENGKRFGVLSVNQHYVEIDKTQFYNTVSHIPSEISYVHNDIKTVMTNRCSRKQHTSILDFDICKNFSDDHIESFNIMAMNLNLIDVSIHTICTRTRYDKLHDEFWASYGIDPTLSYSYKIQNWYTTQCEKVGLVCDFKSYVGKGSIKGKAGGMPMMLVVIYKEQN